MRMRFLLLLLLVLAATCGAQSVQQSTLTSLYAKCVALALFFILCSRLFFSTRGPSWINNMNWVVAQNYCQWFGITCDAAGNVTKVNVIFFPMNHSGSL